jgi:hypothetical protein
MRPIVAQTIKSKVTTQDQLDRRMWKARVKGVVAMMTMVMMVMMVIITMVVETTCLMTKRLPSTMTLTTMNS